MEQNQTPNFFRWRRDHKRFKGWNTTVLKDQGNTRRIFDTQTERQNYPHREWQREANLSHSETHFGHEEFNQGVFVFLYQNTVWYITKVWQRAPNGYFSCHHFTQNWKNTKKEPSNILHKQRFQVVCILFIFKSYVFRQSWNVTKINHEI